MFPLRKSTVGNTFLHEADIKKKPQANNQTIKQSLKQQNKKNPKEIKKTIQKCSCVMKERLN